MFASLGEIIDAGELPRGASRKRTGQPVRAHSRPAGRCEGLFWRRTDRQEMAQIVLAAKRYELATRQPGARNGALGFVALEVIELLSRLVNYRSGRLDPSLDYLMTKLHRSRDAIVRALKALRSHGFLDWLRRFEPTGNEGRGPQVRQTSNAYRLLLPQRARQWLFRQGRPAPLPDDFTHAQEQRTATIEAQIATLSLAERVFVEVEDEGLAESLARFGALVAADVEAKRESAKQSESQSTVISIEE